MVIDKLNSIFQKVFLSQTLKISPEMTSKDVKGWDSLNHINLMLAIEGEFKVKFTTHEILSLKNVGELVRAIESKTGSGGLN